MNVHEKTGTIYVSRESEQWRWRQGDKYGSRREMPLNFFAKEADTGVEVVIITSLHFHSVVGGYNRPSVYNANTVEELSFYRDVPGEFVYANPVWYEVDLDRAYQNTNRS